MSGNEQPGEAVVAEAARWHILSSADDMDWDGFMVWLEADPAHRIAYDQIARADAMLDDYRERLGDRSALENVSSPSSGYRLRSRGWAAFAMAVTAAVVAMVWFGRSPVSQQDAHYFTKTVSMSVALADGSKVLLAPHSQLIVSGTAPGRMKLDGGAYFSVRHNPARPLVISAGPLEIHDIGTHFDVQADSGGVRVAVADGKVEAVSATIEGPVRLASGESLLFDPDSAAVEKARTLPILIGTWRTGRLSYDNTPLTLVAADLERYAGVHLDVPANLRNRRFSGTLAISDAKRAPHDLAQIMGLALVARAGGSELVPATR